MRSGGRPEDLRATVRARIHAAEQRFTPGRERCLAVLANAGGPSTIPEIVEADRSPATSSVSRNAIAIARQTGFRAERHRVDIIGLCGRCSELRAPLRRGASGTGSDDFEVVALDRECLLGCQPRKGPVERSFDVVGQRDVGQRAARRSERAHDADPCTNAGDVAFRRTAAAMAAAR